MSDFSLPPQLARRIGPISGAPERQARLGNAILFVEDKDKGPAVLKIGTGHAAEDIAAEAHRLQWLQGRLPAPRVLYQSAQGDTQYLLMTLLAGRSSHEMPFGLTPEQIVTRFASFLADIHKVSIDACPFVDVTVRDLDMANKLTRSNCVDRTAFRNDVGHEPEEILAYLEARLGTVNEDTFTHGDYCLPNFLISSTSTSGAIDWGLGGISDKHRDFMSVELTIRRNFGDALIPTFYQAYGIEQPDGELIRFYWLLDRFAHYHVER